MDGNISKALWLGVSILLFIAVVTVGLTVFGGMKQASGEANDKINSITQSMAEENFKPFDGKEVKGDAVISAIRNFSGKSGEVAVLVATLGANNGNEVDIKPATSGTALTLSRFYAYVSGTSGATVSVDDSAWTISGGTGGVVLSDKSKKVQDTDLANADDNTQTGKYINPAGRFQAYLLYDQNQVVRGIICAQQVD